MRKIILFTLLIVYATSRIITHLDDDKKKEKEEVKKEAK